MRPSPQLLARSRRLLALLYGVAPVLDPCLEAPIQGRPPNAQEWRAEVGPSVKEVRFRLLAPAGDRAHPSGWIVAREPRWSSDSLVVRRKQAPFDSLAVAWTEIEELDRRHGNLAPYGMAVGALAALGASVALVGLVQDGEGAAGAGAVFYFGLAIGVPLGMAIGGLAASRVPNWVPAFCGKPAGRETDR